ncbi:MAG: shikimate kinase [Rickettsiales bacterium]|jgi:shikimate kinase|nr:shikimate kinase [Rickettsiales bacterium]
MVFLSDETQEMNEKPIVLVGLMGAGKTSMGRALARRLKIPFVDLDLEIEAISGCSVIDIFSMYGEPEFRRIEELVFERIVKTPPHFKVISTGEGAFITPKIRDLALKKTITVWLKADLELLEKRTSFRLTRPQLLAGEPSKILSKLIDERYPIYARADITIDVADEPRARTLKKLVDAIS